jgi:hypothetical protein
MLYLPLTFVEYNCHNPSSLTGQNNGSIFWFFRRLLEEYWRAALTRIPSLEFKLDHAAWDEKRRELNVVYEANLNGERKRACEIMQFDLSGRQIRGEALYGALL